MCNQDTKKKHLVSEKELEKIREIARTLKNDPEAMQQARMLAFSK